MKILCAITWWPSRVETTAQPMHRCLPTSDSSSMVDTISHDSAADLPEAPPPAQFSLRGMLIAVHLACTLLSVPGVGIFVWQTVGPLAAIAAAVIAAQCAIMLLLALLGWLPANDKR